MELPSSKWYPAIQARRSRRKYEANSITASQLRQIKSICASFRPFEDARAVFLTQSPEDIFRGAIGAYGKIRGAPGFIAFIGDEESDTVHEHVGYTGEGIILELEAIGLNSCWVGGTFRPKIVEQLFELGETEKVLAVTPVGKAPKKLSLEERLMAGFGITHKRKPLSKLTIGLPPAQWPTWMMAALEAARLAPSSVNRQPWRFHVERDSIAVATDTSNLDMEAVTSKRLCCGIAMLHVEVAALHHGVKGEWESFSPPLVAKFTVIDNKAARDGK
jgi:nitroreductase